MVFESENGDSTSVVLTYEASSSSGNYTLQLDGASGITFRNLTLAATGSSYSRVIDLRNGASCNTFSNTLIRGVSTTSTSDHRALVYSPSNDEPDNDNRFTGNYMINGSFGFWYSSNSSDQEAGILISDNRLLDQQYMAIYLNYQNSPVIKRNTISTTSSRTDFYGLYLNSNDDSLKVVGNRIRLPNGGYGLYQNFGGSSTTAQGLVANNFISIGGSSRAYGIYPYYCSHQRYYHNNVHIYNTTTSTDASAFYMINGSDNEVYNNILVNSGGGYAFYTNTTDAAIDYNDLYVTGTYLGYYNGDRTNLAVWQSATGWDSHSVSTNPLFVNSTDLHVNNAKLDSAGFDTGIVILDIDGEQRGSPPDIGADEFTPSGTNASLVHLDHPEIPFLSGSYAIKVGLSNTGINVLDSVKIDWSVNEERQTPYWWKRETLAFEGTDTFNIGSVDFLQATAYDIKVWISEVNGMTDTDQSDDTLSVAGLYSQLAGGTYTLGGSSPDFTSFTEAAEAINQGGIIDSVIFRVRPGTYNEQVRLTDFPGGGCDTPVIFESENGDSTSVVLTYNASSSSNYTLQLDGARGIIFRNLTLAATSSNYGRVIDLRNGASCNTFSNTLISGVFPTSAIDTDNMALVYSPSSTKPNNDNRFVGNYIINGSYGFWYSSNSSNRENGLLIADNTLQDQRYMGIYLQYQNSPSIERNTISTTSTRRNFYGLHLSSNADTLKVVGNKISLPNGGYGLYQLSGGGSINARGLIANNFISIGGSNRAYGIYHSFSSHQRYYHNNVHLYSTTASTDASAFYINNGSNNEVYNNILVNSGGGYAFYTNTTDAEVDYNDLYATGTYLGYYNEDRTDLAAWQSATGWDGHSLSVDPLFVDSADLHVGESLLNKTGKAITLITRDIDDEPRSKNTPDIGADEFESPGLDVALIYLEPVESKFGEGVNPIRLVIQNIGETVLDSLRVSWMINSVPQLNYSWTGSLTTGQTDTLTIGSYDFLLGTVYEISATLESPNGSVDAYPEDNNVAASDLYAALSGTYTIGGTSPDFATWNEAVATLLEIGVVGSAIFNVRPGTYNEQVRFTNFPGDDCETPVVFQSENGDSTSVVLTYGAVSGSNYTLQLDGASGITFQNLTLAATGSSYGRVIDLRNGASCNTFSNTLIRGVPNASTSDNLTLVYSPSNDNPNNDNHFTDNYMVNGSFGFHHSYSSNRNSNRETGLFISGNTLQDQGYVGISLAYQNSPLIEKNIISTTSSRTDFNGVYLYDNDDSLKVVGNRISLPNGGYGLYFDGVESSTNTQGLIANNFISIGGSSRAFGIYADRSTYQRYYHNNVHLYSTTTSTNASAFYMDNGSNNAVYNNLLVNSGGGYAFSTNTTDAAVDYNDLYATGTHLGYYGEDRTNLAAWQSATGWDSHSLSVDPNFVSSTDLHVSEISVYHKGIQVAGVEEDIDGEPRNLSQPTLGADAYTPDTFDAGMIGFRNPQMPFRSGLQPVQVILKNFGLDTLRTVSIAWEVNGVPQPSYAWSGLLITGDTLMVTVGDFDFISGVRYTVQAKTSNPNGNPDALSDNDSITATGLYAALTGNYTIGGASPDFATWNEAVATLLQGGIVDSAIFRVRPGTYNEQVRFTGFLGGGCDMPVIFESENGDSTSVVLTYEASSSSNYTLQLDGTLGITFRNLTLAATGNSYGRVIDLRHGASCNTFSNTIISGIPTTSTSSNTALVYSPSNDNPNNDNHFTDNYLINGSFGFHYSYSSNRNSNRETGLFISGNTLQDQGYVGISLAYQNSPLIEKNVISTTSSRTDFNGVYLYDNDDSLKVVGNRISLPNGGYGLYINRAESSTAAQGLVANNFISIGGSSTAYGIYPYYSSDQRYYHNNVHIYSTTTSTSASAFYMINGSNNEVYNNILVNNGGGYAFYTNTTDAAIDYNDLYVTGTYLGYYSGDRTNLAAWQSATGWDGRSVSTNPLFVNSTNLHVNKAELDSAGFNTGVVTLDIDGEQRGSPPDIGADEFTPSGTNASLVYLNHPEAPFLSGSYAIKVSLSNTGIDVLDSVKIDWSVNEEAQAPYWWTKGALAIGEADTLDIGSVEFVQATAYDIKVWISKVNGTTDLDQSDDTLSVAGLHSQLAGGTYTLGGSSPDFISFTKAAEAINQGGIIDSVIFHVRPGTYNEQVRLTGFPGGGCDTPVIFESENGDSTSVVLTYGASSGSSNYTLQLDGASGITFRNLTLAAAGNSYGRVIDLRNGAGCNTFSNTLIRGVSTTSTIDNMALVYSPSNDKPDNDNHFTGNYLINGSYGFSYLSSSSNREDGLLISDNTLVDQHYMGIYLEDQNSPSIEKNTISTTSTRTEFFGMYLNDNADSLKVVGNRISLPNGGYGLYQRDGGGSVKAQGLVANNFISIGGSSTAYGIYPNNSSHQRYYHNNVHLYSTNTSTAASAFYMTRGSNNEVYNNILANSGGGYAFYTNTTSAAVDYNDLYATGTYLGYYSGDRTDLAAWQSATGWDGRSLSINPLFMDSTDLHVNKAELDSAGFNTGVVTLDIDGERRGSPPDIGADEFNPSGTNASLVHLDHPEAPFLAGSYAIKVSLSNAGINVLDSMKIDWSVNEEARAPYWWTKGALAFGETDTLNIGSVEFLQATAYNIKVWISEVNGTTDTDQSDDTLSVAGLYSQLAGGTYTLGGSSPDFTSFTKAAEAINQGGIVDSVIFHVRPGTYSEQVRLMDFPGEGCDIPVIFESENEDSTSVVLTYGAISSSGNYTLQLDGASGITFRNLTLAAAGNSYGRVIDLRNGAGCNTFSNTLIRGVSTTSTGDNMALVYSPSNVEPDNDNHFIGNYLVNGSYGFWYSSNSSNREMGLFISDNTLADQGYMGIYLEDQNSPLIERNTISTTSSRTNFFGLYLDDNADSLKVVGNRISLPNGGYGLYQTSGSGNATAQGLIVNNFISVGGNSTAYGIYPYFSSHQRYYHNNVHLYSTTTSTSASAFYMINGSDNEVYNNILVNSGGGYAFYTNTTNAEVDYNDLYATGTYLGYYSEDQTDLAAWQSATGWDGHSLSADPLFVDSVDLHVNNVLLDGAGIPVPGVTRDIDGQVRDNVSPDIGADEFTTSAADAGLMAFLAPAKPFAAGLQPVKVSLLNNASVNLDSVNIQWEINDVRQPDLQWQGLLESGEAVDVTVGDYDFLPLETYRIRAWTLLPNGLQDENVENDTLQTDSLYVALSGDYTIGGDSAHFSTFSEAIEALSRSGISSPVNFDIRAGNYTEQLSFEEISGASLENTITFQSEDRDSTAVQLSYEARNTADNYVLDLNGATHLKFIGMTIRSIGTSGYGRVIWLRNGSHHNSFTGNVIEGINSNSTSSNYALVYSESSQDNHIHFTNNKLLKGSYAIYLQGASGIKETGTRLVNNDLEGQHYRGIYLRYQNDATITGNQIKSEQSRTDFGGIFLDVSDGSLLVNKNKIWQTNGGYGIALTNSTALVGNEGLVANNFIALGGSSTAYGLYANNSYYQDLYHNSVHITNSNTSSGHAFYLDRGTSGNLNVINNIFSNSGGGYAMYINNTSALTRSDYNDLFVTGTNLGYWSGNITDLTAWQSTTGGDAHSLSENPFFVSDTDLHAGQISLSEAGTPLAEVTEDIDGELRDPVSPTIGADEFSPPLADDAGLLTFNNLNDRFSAGTRGVNVQIKNFGSNNLTAATINWSVNGTHQVPYYWTGDLNPAAQDSVTIGTFDFQTGAGYNIAAWTTDPNGISDSLQFNDTIYVENVYASLEGIYQLGGIAPYFSTFSDAAAALNYGGVLDSVVFEVEDGYYNEQITLRQIPGATTLHTVTFQSASSDSTAVILSYNGDDLNNYTLFLDGVDHLVFRGFTLQAENSSYGRVIVIGDDATNNTFENNRLVGSTTSTNSSPNLAIVYGVGHSNSNNRFFYNRLESGSYAFYYQGRSSSQMVLNSSLVGNHLIGQSYMGIRLDHQLSPSIEQNSIISNSSRNDFYGIYLQYCDYNLEINANQILISNGGYGIYLNACLGITGNNGQTINNFVSVGGSGLAQGIILNNVDNQNIYYNSIAITESNDRNGRAWNVAGGGSNVVAYNNIWANLGGGYAAYISSPSAISNSDHNNLFTTGSALGYWNGDRFDLNQWQVASTSDFNSVTADPLYISNSDLHSRQVALDEAGIPLTGITVDIDGDLRDAQTPDIGADEFSGIANDLAVTRLITPSDDCGQSDTEKVSVAIQNFGINVQTGFDVALIINGGKPIVENTDTLTVEAGLSATYTFSTSVDLSTLGEYTFSVFPLLSGDENNTNDTLQAKVNSYPAINAGLTADTAICLGSSVVLEASGGSTYLWNDGRKTSRYQVTPEDTTTYFVTIGNDLGCTITDSVTVNILPLPKPPEIVSDSLTTICEGDSLLLVSNVSSNIVWNTGVRSDSIYASFPGDYFVTVEDSLGCSSQSRSVTVIYPPKGSAVASYSIICEGDSVRLSALNGRSFRWSTGDTTQNIVVVPMQSTNYVAEIINDLGCIYRDSVFLTVLPVPEITSISSDTSICLGERAALNVSGSAIEYEWSNGASGTAIHVSPDTTTTYYVMATNGEGCGAMATDSVTVFVNPLPVTPEIVPSGSTTICSGDSLLLVSNVMGDLYWSTGERTDAIYVKEAGTYYVSLAGDNACASISLPLTVEVAAVPGILPEKAPTICLGDSVVLSVVNANASYSWSTGDTTAIITVMPIETTTYYVEAANDLGCLYIDSIKVEVVSPPVPGEVSNMLPSNETTGLSLPVLFSWAPATNATSYDLYIWPDTASVPAAPAVDDITSIQHIYNEALEYGTPYSWQLISQNVCHEMPGPIQKFTLRELPDLQVQNVEAPDEAFSEQEISVSWEVINTGLGGTLEQNWTDAIYLSEDTTLSLGRSDFVDEYLLGTANFAALSAGESYSNSATVTCREALPAIITSL